VSTCTKRNGFICASLLNKKAVKFEKKLDFFGIIGYNISVVTHRQTMKPEVASEKGRFFGGVCPIHETGRQSRYNIFLLCGT
jgi:hypothetical protein